MINAERYASEILDIIENHPEFDTPAVVNGVPQPCQGTFCYGCDLNDNQCTADFIKWMFKPYECIGEWVKIDGGFRCPDCKEIYRFERGTPISNNYMFCPSYGKDMR